MGRIVVAGLGAGEVPAIDPRVWQVLDEVSLVVFRTEVHPGASAARKEIADNRPDVPIESMDRLYERASNFDELYEDIAREVANAAHSAVGIVLYLVPGSPFIAEKSVDLLRERFGESLEILPGVSFLELVWSALGIDPFASGVTMIDAVDFPSRAKLQRGPFLLTQVWSRQVLSEVKLSLADPKGARAIVLQRLGTRSEHVEDIAWDDLDKLVDPDHLTCIYVGWIPAVPGPSLVELYDIIARLRNECPWDREQTHQSLVAHLLEECYEVIDVIEKMAGEGDEAKLANLFEELKGELGDLMVQVYFQSNLASEDGRFDLSEVAEAVTAKLIRRHPHVFTELEVSGSAQVVSNWEKIKQTQEGRTSVLEGIPEALPALMLVPKLLRKAAVVGLEIPDSEVARREISTIWLGLSARVESGGVDLASEFGELLWWIANLAREVGIDLESALRSRTNKFIEAIKVVEREKYC